jgi:hypothetical protein
MDEWIVNNTSKFKVSAESLLDITGNLQSFRKYTVFQSGVMAYILTFYEECGEYDELRKVFITLDKS